MIKLICKECNKPFLVKDNRAKTAKYCSKKCAQAHRTRDAIETRICPLCNKEFKVFKYKKLKYCSKECAHNAYRTRVKKICKHCGTAFYVIKTRENTAEYCCRACSDASKKKAPNIICDVCGNPIHRKLSHVLKNKHGNFCSKKCVNEWRKTQYLGNGNHQFGLKGPLNSSFKGIEISSINHKIVDILVYCPDHPFANKLGRVKKHRLIVEQNYHLFNKEYFIFIDGNYYLKPEIVVHHLNCNHNDNDIDNLVPCTAAEHSLYHNLLKTPKNKREEIIRNITAVLKQGELLETPEVDNQQPS